MTVENEQNQKLPKTSSDEKRVRVIQGQPRNVSGYLKSLGSKNRLFRMSATGQQYSRVRRLNFKTNLGSRKADKLSQSLPSLKLSFSKKLDNSHMFSFNSQMVKFDLSNVNRKSLKAAKQSSSKRESTIIKMRLNSNDTYSSDSEPDGVEKRQHYKKRVRKSSKVPSSSSSIVATGTGVSLTSLKNSKHLVKQSTAIVNESHTLDINLSKLSISSSKSNSYRKISRGSAKYSFKKASPERLTKKLPSKANDNDDESRSSLSDQSFSDTELLGNAVRDVFLIFFLILSLFLQAFFSFTFLFVSFFFSGSITKRCRKCTLAFGQRNR